MWQPTGSIITARKMIESDIFLKKPAEWFKIWFFLLNRVNFKDHKQYKRGECLTSYEEIMRYTRASKAQIDHFIRYAKSATMIATRKATRGFYVKVLKFAEYQDKIKTKQEPKATQKATAKAKQKRHKSDTIKNNDNKNKNDNNNIFQAEPDNEVLTEEQIKEKKLNKNIQEIIDLFFNSINPNINYGNKTTRSACKFLIDKYGIEATKKATEYAISIQGQDYAPTITTPYELKEKMTKLIIHKQKEANTKGKDIIGL